MNKSNIGLCVAILVWAISACAQSKIDERGVVQPTEEQIAANRRMHDLLQKPDFITLRLTYGYVYEKPVETPRPYRVGDSMYFELFVSQSLFENIMIEESRWAQYEYRPELRRDGEILSYSKDALKAVDKADHERPSWTMIPLKLVPNREYAWPTVTLGDWYDRLGPGHYELSVRKRFVWDGDWVQSNSVTFDVVPRKVPDPIPAGVSIEIVPENFQNKPKQKLYRLTDDLYITVGIVNNSNREIIFPVVDSYYANRPQLFKDRVRLPYTPEMTKLLRFKDENPSAVEERSDRALRPGERTAVTGLDLKEWYGNLPPGLYKLTNRQRFEFDGPWTADSVELWFEVFARAVQRLTMTKEGPPMRQPFFSHPKVRSIT